MGVDIVPISPGDGKRYWKLENKQILSGSREAQCEI